MAGVRRGPAHARRPSGRSQVVLEAVCVLVVLLALALLLAYVVTNWSQGRTNVLG